MIYRQLNVFIWVYRCFVCLKRFNIKTSEWILINIGVEIVLTMKKDMEYFLLQNFIFKGVK